MKLPQVSDHVMIWFKEYVGTLMCPGQVKRVTKTHITVEWAGHENTYELRNIKSITWNPARTRK